MLVDHLRVMCDGTSEVGHPRIYLHIQDNDKCPYCGKEFVYETSEFRSSLKNREIIEISGADREIFLQGIVTQNVSRLQKEPIIYSLLLSPQGKFQYDFFMINVGDLWLIDVDKERAQPLIQRLQLFKLRANVKINLNPDWHVGVSSSITQHSLEDPRLKSLGYRLYDKNLPFAQTENYENLRLSLGVPDGVRDMVIDKSIPLEWGMDELNAIAWDKGCYMGQELTSRSRYVGQIRKRAFPIEFSQKMNLVVGTKLYIDTNEVGQLCTNNGKIGIALLRLDALNHKEMITIQNHPIKVHKPSWMINFSI